MIKIIHSSILCKWAKPTKSARDQIILALTVYRLLTITEIKAFNLIFPRAQEGLLSPSSLKSLEEIRDWP